MLDLCTTALQIFKRTGAQGHGCTLSYKVQTSGIQEKKKQIKVDQLRLSFHQSDYGYRISDSRVTLTRSDSGCVLCLDDLLLTPYLSISHQSSVTVEVGSASPLLSKRSICQRDDSIGTGIGIGIGIIRRSGMKGEGGAITVLHNNKPSVQRAACMLQPSSRQSTTASPFRLV